MIFQKGFTVVEMIVVMSILSILIAAATMTIQMQMDDGELQETILIAKRNAYLADFYRKRPTATVRNADNSVSYTFGNVYQTGITAALFNTNTGASLYTTSVYGTPFSIVSTNFSTRSVVTVPLNNISPPGIDSRAVAGGTELSISADVPTNDSQNKRTKWKKRVLYLEPAR